MCLAGDLINAKSESERGYSEAGMRSGGQGRQLVLACPPLREGPEAAQKLPLS